ncbi:MAG: hypothetical protein QG585_433 [Patescibacteria group bacterium]|jgi:hypothetical protein|nr:hypothetical protein [Patescibacteria group bacterium]
MSFSKKISIIFGILVFSGFINTVFAYTPPTTPYTVNDIFLSFAFGNMSGLIPTLIAVGLVTFLAGVTKFVSAGDNEEKRAAGRSVMVYGIIVLFVMMSMWGFVRILTQSFFGTDPEISNYLPKPI